MKAKIKRAKVSTKETNEIDSLIKDINKVLTPYEVMQQHKAQKLDKASNLKITLGTNMFDLKILDFAFKYEVLSYLYKSSIANETLTFLQLHELMPKYDIKGLSRDVNTKLDKVLRSVKLNDKNNDTKCIADLSSIWDANKDIQSILAQSENIAKCYNSETTSYNKDLMTEFKIVPRDIVRNKAIIDVIAKFEFNEIGCDFVTETLSEAVNIRSLGKNNDVISYKHNNEIRIIYGFELLKVYVESYGAKFDKSDK